jgi:hypothetical protein
MVRERLGWYTILGVPSIGRIRTKFQNNHCEASGTNDNNAL